MISKRGIELTPRHLLTGIISIVLMLTTIFVSGEILVQYLIRNDTDVQRINGISIPPLHPPLQQIQETIEDYNARINRSPYIYDAQLGWTNQPLYENTTEGIRINASAIRSDRDYEQAPPSDTLRIALFGDSFTYSAGVANEETLDQVLETALAELGIRAEVMNFGVPAYGPDQSYLRWLYEGINYQPDIAILNFSTRMSGRSLNIFRVISSPETRLPFSKPRFYLDGESLTLINSPTIPLEDVMDTLENFKTHPLRPYEYYYDERYIETWWQQSRFLAYLSESIRNTVVSIFGDDSTEVIAVNEAIIQFFADDAQNKNTVFMLGHLPTQKNLSNDEGNFRYYDLLLKLQDQYPLLDASPILTVIDQQDGWLDDGHYNPTGNQVVGQYFAEQIQQCLTDKSCLPPRFKNGQSFTNP